MKRLQTKYRINAVAVILAVFALLFASESIVNHLMFRTYGLDLGVYTNALYDYAHLQGNDCSFFRWETQNLLSDHFDLLLVLLSPLVYLFDSWTLLIVQIAAVLLGAYGVYRLAKLYTESKVIPLAAMLMLLTSFGVWHSLGFDYHTNVLTAMLLPWMLYFVKRSRLLPATVMLVLIAIGKETQAVWLLFVLLALMIDYRRNRRIMSWLAASAIGCVIYTLLVMLWLMPVLGDTGRGFDRFAWMGGNMGEVALWMLSHPLQAMAALFTDFMGSGHGSDKIEFYICLLVSGGWLAVMKPNYLLMLVPMVAMKMLSQDTIFWGLGFHYNIEICTVIVVASTPALCRIKSVRGQTVAAWVAVALSLLTLIYSVSNPYSPVRKENVRIYDARHWRQPDFDVETARRMLREIPSDASVCATTMFTPHLATRDSVYIFPMGLGYGAEYYMLLKKHWVYYKNEDYNEEDMVEELVADTVNYRVIDTDGNLYLVRCLSPRFSAL